MPLEEAAARRGQGGFVWLRLFEPDADELAQMCKARMNGSVIDHPKQA